MTFCRCYLHAVYNVVLSRPTGGTLFTWRECLFCLDEMQRSFFWVFRFMPCFHFCFRYSLNKLSRISSASGYSTRRASFPRSASLHTTVRNVYCKCVKVALLHRSCHALQSTSPPPNHPISSPSAIRLNTTWCEITFANCEWCRLEMWCCCAYFAVLYI